jgi:acetyl-CoA carboxylase carboxyltransferase component
MAEYVETFATPYQAASHALIEQVIEPKETRPAIIRALKMLEGKKEEPRLWRKHGNMPL